MESPKIVVYSQPGCAPCNAAKDYLTRKGVPFEVKDVSADPAAARELTET